MHRGGAFFSLSLPGDDLVESVESRQQKFGKGTKTSVVFSSFQIPGGTDLSYTTGHFILKYCFLKCQLSSKPCILNEKNNQFPAESGLFTVVSGDDSLIFSSALPAFCSSALPPSDIYHKGLIKTDWLLGDHTCL